MPMRSKPSWTARFNSSRVAGLAEDVEAHGVVGFVAESGEGGVGVGRYDQQDGIIPAARASRILKGIENEVLAGGREFFTPPASAVARSSSEPWKNSLSVRTGESRGACGLKGTGQLGVEIGADQLWRARLSDLRDDRGTLAVATARNLAGKAARSGCGLCFLAKGVICRRLAGGDSWRNVCGENLVRSCAGICLLFYGVGEG